ncbi:Resolvase, N terminal domain [Nocardia amikacinitolerans]|nr:Resolvase, N terminal domain [Nocardia amikacinitolerans]
MSKTRAGEQGRQTVGPVYFRRMLIGYGRVSAAEQNPAHQIDALRRAGVAEAAIHIDTAEAAPCSACCRFSRSSSVT